jgi:hypothetical protein
LGVFANFFPIHTAKCTAVSRPFEAAFLAGGSLYKQFVEIEETTCSRVRKSWLAEYAEVFKTRCVGAAFAHAKPEHQDLRNRKAERSMVQEQE